MQLDTFRGLPGLAQQVQHGKDKYKKRGKAGPLEGENMMWGIKQVADLQKQRRIA